MKRIIAFILAISLMASMALSTSAYTLNWDLGNAYDILIGMSE